jgi:CheY-like chemotaxis protein
VQLPSKSILVVDDNQQVCSLTARVLREAGYDVVEAYDGLEALRLLPTTPGLQLLVTDVMMPGLDGFDLASHISAACNVPVLFISAYPPPDSEIPGPVLLKPFAAETLLDMVARLLALTCPSANSWLSHIATDLQPVSQVPYKM